MIKSLTAAVLANLTLVEADTLMEERVSEMKKIQDEAATADGKFHFGNVKSYEGEGVKGSVAVADYVRQLGESIEQVGKVRDTLISAENAMKMHKAQSEPRRGFELPGGRGNYGSQEEREKSLGEMIAESKSYQDWAKLGAAGGHTLQFEEMKASTAIFGTKAVMMRTAGYEPEVIRAAGFVNAITRPIQVIDIIPMIKTGQSGYAYMEETLRDPNAQFAAEAALYAEGAFAFAKRQVPVEKITASLPITDEQLEDVEGMQGYVDGRLTFGIRQRADEACVLGTGATPQIRGLKNLAGIQTRARGADSRADAFYKARTRVRVTGRSMPTHFLIHSFDWEAIRLEKDVDGNYKWGPPSEAGPNRMWGLPVVEQDIDVEGRGYCGAFTPDCVLAAERRGVDVQVGFVGTQFLQGLRTMRADCRMALAWLRPVAFHEITGLNA